MPEEVSTPASLGWEPVDPNGLGYMPFSDAAYWIATEGHNQNVDVSLPETWEHAYQQLVDRISAGEVQIIGRRDGVGTAAQIEGYRFAGVRIVLPAFVGKVDDPEPEVMTNDPTVLCDFRIGNDWRNQFDDKLYAASVLKFSHLMVRKTDIARLWPSRPTEATATTDREQPSPEASSSAVPDMRKRGRKPKKLEQVKEAMRRDIQEGRQTTDSLRTQLEKNLASVYGVSRDTARRARKAVLSEFVENSNSDK